MRFVPVASAEQQAILSLHRIRQGSVEERNATINRIRGRLTELGFVLPQRADRVSRAAIAFAENLPQKAPDGTDRLSRWAVALRQRRGYHRAVIAIAIAIAIAAKNARIIWALLAKEADFVPVP